MKSKPFSCASLCLVLAACLSGCLNLKPVQTNTRYLVLSAGLQPEKAANQSSPAPTHPTLGIGSVKLPSYLTRHSLAVRKSTNEIEYLDGVQWAEGLEHGFQRALAQNLGAVFPRDGIRLPPWRVEDVSLEIYVSVEQFEVDTTGQGSLVARWRILSPGGEKVLGEGETHGSATGPAPVTDPSGAASTLSQLVANLSQKLADAIKGLASATTVASP